MRNRRQGAAQRPVEAPVTAPAPEAVAEPQEAPVDVSRPEANEPYVSPAILAAQRGEQVEFGSDIIPVEGSEAVDDTDPQE